LDHRLPSASDVREKTSALSAHSAFVLRTLKLLTKYPPPW